MSRRVSPSTAKPYGIERVTRLRGVSRATVHRRRRPDGGGRRRPGPVGAMPDAALVGETSADLAGRVRRALPHPAQHIAPVGAECARAGRGGAALLRVIEAHPDLMAAVAAREAA